MPKREEYPTLKPEELEEAIVEEPPKESDTEPKEEEVKLVKVGEEEIPEEELVKGYMRSKDYTQKTQEIARQREEMALRQEEFEERTRKPKEEEKKEDDYLSSLVEAGYDKDDPLVKLVISQNELLKKVYTETEAEKTSRADRELNAQMAEVTKVDPDVDEMTLLKFASSRRMDNLVDAHYLMTRESVLTRARNEGIAEERKRLETKREAFVEPPGGQFIPPSDKKASSYKEAGERAKEELGINK